MCPNRSAEPLRVLMTRAELMSATPQAWVSQHFYSAPIGVRLIMSTPVSGRVYEAVRRRTVEQISDKIGSS